MANKDSENNIRSWFTNNIPGGLEKYLTAISRDIEEIEKAETRAKARIDFVKTVEQVLSTLDHLNTVDTGKEVIFNFEPVTEEQIKEHWGEE